MGEPVHQQTPGRGGRGGHDHGVSAGADKRYLTVALALIAVFMAVEVTVAITSGSVVLLADAGHMLSDAGAIGVAIWAISLASRPAHGSWTFGFKRAEILSAAGNGITLPALSAHIVVTDDCFISGHCPQILDQLQTCLAGHFDVEHSTFQLEPAGHAAHETGAHA
jgi:Co/Zn/Cd efflux system component